MPLTTRLLALRGEVPVSPLFREILRAVIDILRPALAGHDLDDRMSVYEQRDTIYLAALEQRELLYRVVAQALDDHHRAHGRDPGPALQALQLDEALCPRQGAEQSMQVHFGFDAITVYKALAAMEQPPPPALLAGDLELTIRHPGGVGDILQGADGGSWLAGSIATGQAFSHGAGVHKKSSELGVVALA